jgi:hypothetical protein
MCRKWILLYTSYPNIFLMANNDVVEQTRRAFAPPTERQKRLQREARAKGGLSPRGIKSYVSRSVKQQNPNLSGEQFKQEVKRELTKLEKQTEARNKLRKSLSKNDRILLRKGQEAREGGNPKFESERDVIRAIQLESKITGKGRTRFNTEKLVKNLRKEGKSNIEAFKQASQVTRKDEILYSKPQKREVAIRQVSKVEQVTKKAKSGIDNLLSLANNYVNKPPKNDKIQRKIVTRWDKAPKKLIKTNVLPSAEKVLKIKKNFKELSKETKRQTVQGVTNVVTSYVTMFTKPKQFLNTQVSAVKTAVKNPVATAKAYGKYVIQNPATAVVEFIAFNKSLGAVGKIAKNSPVSNAIRTELFIKSYPKELQKYVRPIVKSAKAQKKVFGVKPKKTKIDFAEVKELSKIEAKAVEKALKGTDSVLFGSLSARALTKKKTPVPKDVDLATANFNKFEDIFLKSIPKNKRGNYIIEGESIVRKTDGAKILDVKPLDRIYPDKTLLSSKSDLPVSGWGTTVKIKKTNLEKRSPIEIKKGVKIKYIGITTEKPVKVGGIKTVPLGEQVARKGLGTLQVLIERNARRSKDPQSFIMGLEIQLETLKKSNNILNRGKIKTLENAIKTLKSKEFEKVLNNKVPNLTKEFPLVTKINFKKLQKAIASTKNIDYKRLEVRNGKLYNTQTKKFINKPSESPLKSKTSVLPSKLPKKIGSYLPKISKLPSALPRSKLPASKLPSIKVPSKLPPIKIPTSKIPPSKIPTSKLPTSKIPPSKIPTSKLPTSKIPPSKIPPSKIPPRSRLPPSRLPPSRLPPSRLPPSRLPPVVNIPVPKTPSKLNIPEFEWDEDLKKFIKKLPKKNYVFSYSPTIAGLGRRATRTTGGFSGFEVRGNIIKPIVVKRHKRKTLRNKAFVRKHRRRKSKR